MDLLMIWSASSPITSVIKDVYDRGVPNLGLAGIARLSPGTAT